MKIFLFIIYVFCYSTSVFAGYCSDDLWKQNQRKQSDFSYNWRTNYANYKAQLDNFRKAQLIHRNYSAREMEAYCHNKPEDCRKMFEKNAVTVETVANMTKFQIEKFETLINEGETLIDEWHVLAGACHERNPDNLKRGKENAASVYTDLEKARQFLFELKLIYFLYQQEKPLLQHIEKILKEIKAEGNAVTSSEKP